MAAETYAAIQQLPSHRLLLDGILQPSDCMELIAVHHTACTVGYRPNVCSTLLQNVARCAPHLLLPMITARHAVWQAVEQAMGLEGELFVEFTALMSWGPGASIGWHHDANRPYLQQRHISAVLYLNTGGGVDFQGGELQFSMPDPDGGPSVIVPAPGRLAVYTADDRNTHQVTPVIRCCCSCCGEGNAQAADGLHSDTTVGANSDMISLLRNGVLSNPESCAASCTGAGRCSGQRYTLSMWFTLDAGAQEDRGLLPTLRDLQSGVLPPRWPVSMYINQEGQDVRYHTLSVLGCLWRQVPSRNKRPKLTEAPAALTEAITSVIAASPVSGQLAVTESRHHHGGQELLSNPVALDPPGIRSSSDEEAVPNTATSHSLSTETRLIEEQCRDTHACKRHAVSAVDSKRGSGVDAEPVGEAECGVAITLSAQLRSQGELFSNPPASDVEHSIDLYSELVFDSVEEALTCMAYINWQLKTKLSSAATPTLQFMRSCHEAYRQHLAAMLPRELASWLHLGVLLPAGDET